MLLTDPSPNLRLLVLRELLHRIPDDEEVNELKALCEQDSIVQDLLALQNVYGSWRSRDGASDNWSGITTTTQALLRLGYLGFGPEHNAVRKGAE